LRDDSSSDYLDLRIRGRNVGYSSVRIVHLTWISALEGGISGDLNTIRDEDIRAQRMDHEAIDSVMPSQPRFALCDSNDGDSSVCLISESEGEDDK